MRNKTKEELLKELEELQNKLEIAENDVDYWQHEYNEMEEKVDELEQTIENITICDGIKDTNNFIHKLETEGLCTPEIQDFINNYLRFYN